MIGGNEKLFRRIRLLTILLVFIVILTGCSMDPEVNPIDPQNGIWDKYFVFPLSYTLDWFADLFWNEYGISILIVTIIIRILILPLAIKQYRSSKQMQAIQPEIRKIQQKYKDDKQKQQEETMKLFQKHGVNPLAGCFPVLVQMPVLIALYHAIMRNSEISSHSFLWLQLGERDLIVLPLLAAATTYIQQKMMMQFNPAPTTGPNPMQALLVVFPVLIFVMAMSFPSALPLYWIFSNLFTIGQTYFLYGGSQKKGGLSK